MRFEKQEIEDAKNLIYACECCGKVEGLRSFATMASLAEKLQAAIEEASKETPPNKTAKKRGT